jgi:hypothetical protein
MGLLKLSLKWRRASTMNSTSVESKPDFKDCRKKQAQPASASSLSFGKRERRLTTYAFFVYVSNRSKMCCLG